MFKTGVRNFHAQKNDRKLENNLYNFYFIDFSFLKALEKFLAIYLKNDYPLIIRYNVANLGEVKLVLAPIKSK